MSKTDFMESLGRNLVPILREAGFGGQSPCWTRIREPFIDCVDVQTRSDDAACCVNLGEHLTFLPVAAGSRTPNVETMTTVDCEMKRRLAPKGYPEHWWSFENVPAETADLINCFQAHAEEFFGQYRNFPKPFTDLELADIDSDVAIEMLFPMMTKIRRILLIARVYDHLQDRASSLAWAEFGIANAGMAVGPKAAFRQIVRKYK